MWIPNNSSGSVTKLRAKDGANLGTFPFPGSPWGVAFDGANIWVTGSPVVVEYKATNGTQLGSFYVESETVGAAFDGANVWVAATYKNAVNKF
jgi:glutamine cyclotransferase